MKNTPLLSLLTAAAIASCLQANAASFTWDGDSGTNVNWTEGGNWVGGNAPANDGTATTIFNVNATPPANYYSPVINSPYNINSLQLQSNSNNGTKWNLTGSTLTFSGANSAITVTPSTSASTNVLNQIDNNISLNTTVSVTIGSSNSYTANLILNGNISGTGAISLGGQLGTLRLTGNNTFSGGVFMNRGILAIGSNTALGTGTLTLQNTSGSYGISGVGSTVYTIDNAIANRDGTGSTRFTGNLTFTGGIVLGNTSALTTASRSMRAAQNSSIIFNGNVSTVTGASGAAQNFSVGGSTAFSSEGSSRANQANTKLTFNGDSSYTGTTILGVAVPAESPSRQFGTVFINGDFSSSSGTTVNNGMALRGIGHVAATTVLEGATISPGGSAANATEIGVLTINNSLSIAGTGSTAETRSIMRFDLTSAGAASKIDIVGGGSVVGADFTLGNDVTLSLNGTLGLGHIYTLVGWEEALTPSGYGSFATITLNGSTANWDAAVASGWSLEYGATGLRLIPEPSTYALLAITGLALVVFRRRRAARH